MIISGQGPLYIGDWNQTLKTIENQVAVGCAARTLQTNLTVSKTKIKESCSGLRQTLIEHVNEKTATVTLAMQQFDKKMLAMALFGSAAVKANDNVVDELMPMMAVGDYHHTRHPRVSGLTIQDSAETPVTLTANTHFVVENETFGRVKILDIAGFTQPFKVSYAYAETTIIKPLSLDSVVRGIVFDGVSTVDDGAGVTEMRVIIPKISFPVADAIDWISDDALNLKFTNAEVLSAGLDGGDALGNFGLVELLG